MTDITNDPVAAAAAQLQDAAPSSSALQPGDTATIAGVMHPDGTPVVLDAVPSSTEPTIIERIEEGLHSLEAKVEHLIHPESAPEVSVQAPEVAAEQEGEQVAASAEPAALGHGESDTNGAASNATQGSSAPQSLGGEAGNVSGAVGIVGITAEDASSASAAVQPHLDSGAIRTHLLNIKKHLSLRGFEMELVQDIHRELAAIESYL